MKRKIQWLLWKLGKMLEKKDPKKRPRLHKQVTVVTGEDHAVSQVNKQKSV